MQSIERCYSRMAAEEYQSKAVERDILGVWEAQVKLHTAYRVEDWSVVKGRVELRQIKE